MSRTWSSRTCCCTCPRGTPRTAHSCRRPQTCLPRARVLVNRARAQHVRTADLEGRSCCRRYPPEASMASPQNSQGHTRCSWSSRSRGTRLLQPPYRFSCHVKKRKAQPPPTHTDLLGKARCNWWIPPWTMCPEDTPHAGWAWGTQIPPRILSNCTKHGPRCRSPPAGTPTRTQPPGNKSLRGKERCTQKPLQAKAPLQDTRPGPHSRSSNRACMRSSSPSPPWKRCLQGKGTWTRLRDKSRRAGTACSTLPTRGKGTGQQRTSSASPSRCNSSSQARRASDLTVSDAIVGFGSERR